MSFSVAKYGDLVVKKLEVNTDIAKLALKEKTS